MPAGEFETGTVTIALMQVDAFGIDFAPNTDAARVSRRRLRCREGRAGVTRHQVRHRRDRQRGLQAGDLPGPGRQHAGDPSPLRGGRASPGLNRRYPAKNSRIAACVSSGASSCGTWPQSSSTWRAAGRARSTCFMNAIGTSWSWRPQTNSESGASPASRVQKPVLAVGLVEVDVARRRVEGGAPARGRGRRAGTRRRPAADQPSLPPGTRRRTIGSMIARGAGWIRPSSGSGSLQQPAPAAVAQPGQRRGSAGRAARRGRAASRPASIATRPPMLLPTRCARSISSASSSAATAPGEVGRVVGGGERLVGLAEAGQVDGDHPVAVGERGDGRAGTRPWCRRGRGGR